jgi:hypothetical protein
LHRQPSELRPAGIASVAQAALASTEAGCPAAALSAGRLGPVQVSHDLGSGAYALKSSSGGGASRGLHRGRAPWASTPMLVRCATEWRHLTLHTAGQRQGCMARRVTMPTHKPCRPSETGGSDPVSGPPGAPPLGPSPPRLAVAVQQTGTKSRNVISGYQRRGQSWRPGSSTGRRCCGRSRRPGTSRPRSVT